MKILIPTDFSNNSINALEYGVALAKQLHATIDLMQVFHLGMEEAGRIAPYRVAEVIDEKRNKIKSDLKKLASSYEGVVKDIRVDYGLFIHQEIADAAKSGGYDLILLGTKGEHNLVEKILGSVTSNIMLQASCPVLAIPENCKHKKINKIAYANDFHPQHTKAIQQLGDFSQSLGASIHFVHVDEKGRNQQIEDFKLASGKPFKDFSIVDNKNVVEGLKRFMNEKEIDLLALFIPKRGLWEKLFHFSISKEMSFQTNHPILIFHE